MKVSIVIICWNDRDDILNCIESVYRATNGIRFEVIVTDNCSSDGSVSAVRNRFPQVKIVENLTNRGFGGGNNAGFREARGEYVLILNPDTTVHDQAIEKLVRYADDHPEAGAFGCRVLNTDGTLQHSAHPPHTLRSCLIAALYLRGLERISRTFESDIYLNWGGNTDRTIGFQAGCCILIRRDLLERLGGFDERLFHQCEDADLCKRVWQSGYTVRFCPDAEITHIGGQNRGRYPIRVILETQRSRYRYFYKHHGSGAVLKVRWISLLNIGLRFAGYRMVSLLGRYGRYDQRLEMYRILLQWHWRIQPMRFIETGEEPDLGYTPLAPPPNMFAIDHASDLPELASD